MRNEFNNRYAFAARRMLKRLFGNGKWRPYLVATPANSAVTASNTVEEQVSLPPGSWLLGFAGVSENAAGFRVQILDPDSRTVIWSSPPNYQNVTGPDPTMPNPVRYLTSPLFLPGGFLRVQVRNLAGATNNIQFTLYTAVPA